MEGWDRRLSPVEMKNPEKNYGTHNVVKFCPNLGNITLVARLCFGFQSQILLQ